jgi:tryptophan 2,3-dioxygenase
MPNNKDFSPEILDKLNALQKKYAAMGQDISSYLDGLLYADFLTYWDYINLDTLLNLQQPITPYPDEKVFIIYHQITELYFKLCLHEFDRVAQSVEAGELTPAFLLERVRRINRYFEALTSSFDIMVDGMDAGEFLKVVSKVRNTERLRFAQHRLTESLTKITERNFRTPQLRICPSFSNIYTGAKERPN